jgi:hypothetical protein
MSSASRRFEPAHRYRAPEGAHPVLAAQLVRSASPTSRRSRTGFEARRASRRAEVAGPGMDHIGSRSQTDHGGRRQSGIEWFDSHRDLQSDPVARRRAPLRLEQQARSSILR